MSLWYANAHWNTVALWFDGQAWDATKFNTALSLFYQKKFANTFLTLDLLALTPEGNAFVPYFAPAAPWVGFSLSYLANFIAGHNAVARASAGGGGASATGLLANVLIPPAAKGASVDGSRSEVAAVTTPTQQPRAEVATAAAVGAGKLAAKKEA